MNLCITESHVSEIATALFGDNGEEKFWEAVNVWNNKCPNVTIVPEDEKQVYGSYYNINFYINDSLQSYGDTSFDTGSSGQDNISLPANYCNIDLNIGLIEGTSDSEAERKWVIIHELGHALMMTHPGRKENGECYVLSVMNGGDPNSPASLTTFEPSLYDIYFLNQRWI